MKGKLEDTNRLDLIREAIANIDEFLGGIDTLETFENNKILCHAVVYNLQCVGEGVYKLSPEFISAHPEINWKEIEGLRHVLVHDYYTLNMRTIWEIVQRDLPPFKQYLKSL